MGTSLLLTDSLTNAAYMSFPVHDSTDRPTEFKDGLPTYVKLTKDYGMTENPDGQTEKAGELEQFLLCTSCTISYIFGVPDSFLAVDATVTEMM